MTCQEVMEYMQRSLDGDLDAQENELMMDHIRDCPDCADMYERLNRLSSELENLPKVTPSYSLVDAILPRLELLDEMRGEPEAEQSAAEGGELHSDSEISAARSSRRAKPQRRFINTRTIGGVASAAVVAAIFIALYNTPGFSGLMGRNAATDTADMSQAASSASEVNKTEKPLLNEFRAAEPEPDEVRTESVETYGNQESSSEGNSAANGGKSEGSAGAGAGGSANVVSPEEGSPGDASGSDAAAKEVPSSSYTPGSELNEDNAVTDELKSSANAGGGATGDQGEGSGFAPPEVEEQQSDSEEPDVMGMAVVPGPIQAESPDGRYSAVSVGYTIKIFENGQNDENGEPVFETERKNGKIADLIWSKDGTELTYEVELVQGGQERYVIDMETMEDTKAPVE